MSTFLASLVLVALVALLCLSAAAKAVHRTAFRDVLEALGVGPSFAPVVVWFVIAVEWTGGVALALWPTSAVTAVALGALFGAFAALGLYALVSHKQIHCGCFGAVKSRGLGWPQLVQLPLLIGSLLIVSKGVPYRSAGSALITLILGHCAAAILLTATFGGIWRRVRLQRLSLGVARSFAINLSRGD